MFPALIFLCCSILPKNSFRKTKSSSSSNQHRHISDPPLSFQKTNKSSLSSSHSLKETRELSKVSGFSDAENGFAGAAALEELHNRFLKADYEIRRGMAEKDPERTSSGLKNLQRLFFGLHSQEDGDFSHFQGPGKKEALAVLDRVNALLENHLTIFSQGKPRREDYWRLAKDYQSLLDGAFEYWTNTASKQNDMLRDFVERKTQTAGPLAAAAAGVFIAAVGAVIFYISRLGVKDDTLFLRIKSLQEALQQCSNGEAADAYAEYKKSGQRNHLFWSNISFIGGFSYAKAETLFSCNKDKGAFEDDFGSAGYRWGRGAMCESIGAASKQDCNVQKWLCENLKELKRCLQAQNIHIKWLSAKEAN